MQNARWIDREIRGQSVAGRFIKMGDDTARDPPADCGYKNHQIEQAVNGCSQQADALLLAGSGFWVAGEISRDQADRHQHDDDCAKAHVVAQWAKFGRISVGDFADHEIAKAQLQADHDGQQPVQGNEDGVVAGDGHVAFQFSAAQKQIQHSQKWLC